MRTIKNIMLVLVACAGVACNDFLDEKVSKTTSLVPGTTDHLEDLLNDYTQFYQETNKTAVFGSDDYGVYTELYEAHNRTYGTSELMFALWDIEYLPNESVRSDFWTKEYEKIFTANMVMDYLSKVSGDENTKARLNAEAHLIRAYSMFQLANTYCLPYTEANKDELGLTMKQTISFEESTSRATLEETYARIESDLQEALKLDVELVMQNGKYRTWRGSTVAVYAFAARYYLFRNNYTEALKYAEEALKKHSELMDYNTDMHYSEIETPVIINQGTPEEEKVIMKFPYTYESQFDMTDKMEWKEFYYFRMLSNDSWWYIPSKELLALYDKEYDLRYKYHMVENYSYDQGLTKPAYKWPGYVFFFDQIPSGPTVAEMILTKAECQARLGNYGDAMNTVNILRAKRMDAEAGADVINLSAASKDEAIAEILKERRREMPFTMRWFDIRRLNNNEDANDDVPIIKREFYPYTNAGVLNGEPIKTYMLEKNSRRFAQPITNTEIQSSLGAIQQNRY